ncbi:DUF3857 domain-containing protein [Pedobacter sp. AW31-3R]|uniref:DUF3857 domain-containing protein n=1 Tax=Pedobacter sp. AW31-3R TaxID=3445781 RepID=UPI003F9F127B
MFADSLKKVFFVVFLLFFNNLLSFSQHKNFNISRSFPSWIVKINTDGEKVKAKDVVDGYYASLMEAQHHVELQERFSHVFREITSEAGVQNGSQLSITYDPSYQKLTVHKVTVWRNNQPIDKLSGTKFKVLQNEKDLSKFIYSGTFDAYLLLDDIRKGDRIEYAYTLKGNNPIWGDKYSEELYFEGAYRHGHSYTNILVDKDRKLKFKAFNSAAAPKVSDKDGLKLYEWESKQTNTYPNADFEPSWYNPFKRTQISEYNSWEEIVDWGLKVNDYADLKTPGVDKLAEEFKTKARNNPLTYMELAVRFVQDEIRYMGIEIGEYSQRPNSPEKVLQQRYGDCKDKSLLLVYLLKKANIPAYMAYVDTYEGKKLDGFLPSPFLFNHVVVMVDYQNQKTWIDPTISYQRGPVKKLYFPDYGKALVLKKGIKSPEKVISPATGKLIANLKFKVADTSSSTKTTLVIKSRYTDNYADNIRSLIADEGTDGVQKSFLEYIKSYYPEAESNADIKINDNEKENRVELTESYAISDVWILEEEEQKPRNYIYFYGDLIYNQLRKLNIKNRVQPLSLKYPANLEQHVSIELPYVPDFGNDSWNMDNDYFSFDFDATHKDHVITLNYYFKSLKADVPSEEVKKYIKDSKNTREKLSFAVFYDEQKPGGDLNSYTIMLAVLVIIVSGFFFMKVYQQEMEFDLKAIADVLPIRGLLIIVAFMLVSSIIYYPFQLKATGLFSNAAWDFTESQNLTSCIFTTAVYLITIIGYAIDFSWMILLFFLFINRRELLPEQAIKSTIFSTALYVLVYLAGLIIKNIQNQPVFNLKELITIFVGITFSILWILYFKRSSRVARTFVFTYPESSWKNAIHEQQNTLPQKD